MKWAQVWPSYLSVSVGRLHAPASCALHSPLQDEKDQRWKRMGDYKRHETEGLRWSVTAHGKVSCLLQGVWQWTGLDMHLRLAQPLFINQQSICLPVWYMLYRTHRLAHPQCIFISSFITHVIRVSYDMQCMFFFVVVKLSSPCYTMLCNVIIWCSVKCVYMHEYMEEGGHSVTDNGVIWWCGTVHTELKSRVLWSRRITLEGLSESVLHFGIPLYERIFIEMILWHHAVLSTKRI